MKNIKLYSMVFILLLIVLARGGYVYYNRVRFGTYHKIIAAISSHRMSPDKRGVVKLPPQWASVTARGIVYVNYDHATMMIIFPFSQGKDANLHGYLYVSAPLAPSAFHGDAYGTTDIDFLIGDRIPGYLGEAVPIVVDKKLSTHWYQVSRTLD